MSEKQQNEMQTEENQAESILNEEIPMGADQEGVSEETVQAEEAVEHDLTALLEEAQKEAQSQKDLALRIMADMENLKRRTRMDVESAHKFALEKFVNALIPVMDSMEMGLDAAKNDDVSLESIREGMEMTLKQTIDVMNEFNVERVDPKGETFDPQKHEAMTMVPSPDHESNTVMDVIQKGYILNDRLVRPARVIVAQ